MSDWTNYQMYCPNSGTLISGAKGSDGKIRYRCPRCRAEIIRTIKGRRHDTIEVYAPRKPTTR